MVAILSIAAMIRPSMADNTVSESATLEVQQVQLTESNLLALAESDLAVTSENLAVVIGSGEPDVAGATVRLQEDGELIGRVRLVYATGKSFPVDAELTFSGEQGVVQKATTDERGIFHVANLNAGRYVATAAIAQGSANFRVNLLPYDEEAMPGEMFLDASLSPTPEIVPVEAETADEPTPADPAAMVCSECRKACNFPECGGAICDDCGELVCGACLKKVSCDMCNAPQMACGCSGGGGGGCCGGGGFGWLGVAGLTVGITAIAIGDGDARVPVSPVRP